MINVNKITSTLAKLPDQQLQQYAQMHKSDPYIMALAMSESNRRKEMRSAGQGAQGMQEQPKVVDQEIARMGNMQGASPEQLARLAQMLNARKEAEYKEFTGQQPQAPAQTQQLPEDMGIGRLNAGEMNFAGGGIIAFADGGDVEHYFGGGSTATQATLSSADLSRLYQLDPKLAADATRGLRMAEAASVLRKLSVPAAVYDAGAYATEAATNTVANLMTPEQRSGLYSNPMMGAMAGDAGFAGAIMNAPDQTPSKPTSFGDVGKALSFPLRALIGDPALDTERKQIKTAGAPDAASIQKVSASPYVPSAPKSAEEAALLSRYPTNRPKDAPKVDPTRKGPGAGPAASVAGPKAPAQAGLGDLATTYADILKKQDFKDPAEARLAALESKELADKQEAKAALLRDQAKFDDAYKGREKRLSDRELDIGKQKDTNMGLAFLNAGLAIMSTPGGLATAIGKGAQVGTAQFAAGLDKIRSAQERLDDARDKMEDLKLNRAEMSAKEIRAAEKDIRNVGIDAEKRGIDGLRMAADVNRKTADSMFKATVDVGVNRERMASAEGIAAMQERGAAARAARNPQLELLEAVNKDPKLAAAYQSMHGKGEDVMGQYNDFLKANPAIAMDPQQAVTQFLMTKSVFSQLGKTSVTDKPSTKVRTQP